MNDYLYTENIYSVVVREASRDYDECSVVGSTHDEDFAIEFAKDLFNKKIDEWRTEYGNDSFSIDSRNLVLNSYDDIAHLEISIQNNKLYITE